MTSYCLHSLLLYGMVCCLDERYSEAEQFFEMATTTDPENAIAWTMRGELALKINKSLLPLYYTCMLSIIPL